MSKSENKTKPTKLSVGEYIGSIDSLEMRKDAKKLLTLFKEATKARPVMWGSIVGFGNYHYKYDSGREGDFLATGFAIRKSGPTVYIMPGYNEYSKLMEKLGPHKLGKSCLYIKKLDEIDVEVLKKLVKVGLADLTKKYSVTLN